MVIPDTLSRFIPHPGPDLPLDIAIHHAHIMPDCKEAFQQAFINDLEMRALANLITGWPEDIKEVPHPPQSYWQHRETLTIEDSLVLQGEALIIPPTKREENPATTVSIPSGNNKVILACMWKFLLAWHLPVWSLQQFQSQNAAASLTPTPTSSHPWQMCATDIFMLEGIDHLVVGDFYSKIILVWCFPHARAMPTGLSHCWRRCFQSMASPKSALWQWPTICECPVCQLLYILGHITWNLKSALPTIQWICWGMCQVCQTCTPMSQIQQCQSTSALLALWATPINTKLPSLQQSCCTMPTQNNHSGQDTQQWPISPTSLWTDRCMHWIC